MPSPRNGSGYEAILPAQRLGKEVKGCSRCPLSSSLDSRQEEEQRGQIPPPGSFSLPFLRRLGGRGRGIEGKLLLTKLNPLARPERGAKGQGELAASGGHAGPPVRGSAGGSCRARRPQPPAAGGLSSPLVPFRERGVGENGEFQPSNFLFPLARFGRGAKGEGELAASGGHAGPPLRGSAGGSCRTRRPQPPAAGVFLRPSFPQGKEGLGRMGNFNLPISSFPSPASGEGAGGEGRACAGRHAGPPLGKPGGVRRSSLRSRRGEEGRGGEARSPLQIQRFPCPKTGEGLGGEG